MKRVSTIFVVTCLLLGGCKTSPPKDYLLEPPEERTARMAWWKEARFGMFIHWGVYAVPAGTYKGAKIPFLGEWIMHRGEIPAKEYETFAQKFNPVKFDARQWVKLAKRAGMKYIIITSKHHDGFALWDSKITRWDVMDASPFGRDILRELSDACKKEGVHLGFYHSIMDWHHPDAQGLFHPNYNDKTRPSPRFPHYVESYMKPQLRELLSGYGDIDVLWFDGSWIADWTEGRARDLYNYVRNLKPDILINNRVDARREQTPGTRDDPYKFVGDFGTPEQRIPSTGLPGVDWESCITMNDTWGFKSYDDNWKSSALLTRVLIDIVSKGGNLLLNVGPTAEGLIPDPSVTRLNTIGEWMDINGEAIWGAQASPFEQPKWGRYTRKGHKIYAHLFVWPTDGKIALASGDTKVKRVYLLNDKKRDPLKFQRNPKGILVDLPDLSLKPDPGVLVIDTEE